MSSGTRRVGRGTLVGLAATGLLTAACGGGGSGGKAASSSTTSSSTTSSTRGGSTTAGPAPVTPATASAGATTTTAGGTTTTAPGQPSTVRVDASQNGRTVVVHLGDTVQVSLTGCADCGYSWRMTGQPSPVVFTYEGEQSTTPSTTSTSAGQPPVVGQPVTWTWTFKAVSAHTTGFIAQYSPPGQGTKATQTFAVQLRVSA